MDRLYSDFSIIISNIRDLLSGDIGYFLGIFFIFGITFSIFCFCIKIIRSMCKITSVLNSISNHDSVDNDDYSDPWDIPDIDIN